MDTSSSKNLIERPVIDKNGNYNTPNKPKTNIYSDND